MPAKLWTVQMIQSYRKPRPFAEVKATLRALPAPPLKYIPSSRAHTGLQISHVVLLLGGAWRCSAGSTSIPARSFTTVYVRPWFCFWVDFRLMHLTLSCPAAAFTDLDDTLGQMLEKLPPTEQRPTPGCRACRNPAHGHAAVPQPNRIGVVLVATVSLLRTPYRPSSRQLGGLRAVADSGTRRHDGSIALL